MKQTRFRSLAAGSMVAAVTAGLLFGTSGAAVAGPTSGAVNAQFLSSAKPGGTVQLAITTTEPAVPNPVYAPQPLDQGYFAITYDPGILSFVSHQRPGACTVTPAGYVGGWAQASCPEAYAGAGVTKSDVFTLRVAGTAPPGTVQPHVWAEYSTVNASADPVLTIIGSAAPPIVGHEAPVSDAQGLVQGCADVMFVGVRGSGQTNAWGAEVSPIANQANRLLPQSISLRQVYIDYTSASVPSIVSKGYGQYFDSIADGQIRLTNLLVRSATNCPREKWILAGYSQGALVVNLASRGWAGNSHLAALNLIADPDRFPMNTGTNFGSAGANKGIYAAGMQGATSLPAALSARTYSLCNSMDIVCDTTSRAYAPVLPLLLAGGPLGRYATSGVVKHGVDVHTSYTRTSFTQLVVMGTYSASRARTAVGR